MFNCALDWDTYTTDPKNTNPVIVLTDKGITVIEERAVPEFERKYGSRLLRFSASTLVNPGKDAQHVVTIRRTAKGGDVSEVSSPLFEDEDEGDYSTSLKWVSGDKMISDAFYIVERSAVLDEVELKISKSKQKVDKW